MAESKVPQYYRKAFQDFSGGLNDFSSPLIVKPNQFTELSNAWVNQRGLLEKSMGYQLDGSPFPDDVDSFCRMMVNYKRGTTVDKLVVSALDDGNANANYKVDIKETSGDGAYAYIGHTTGTSGAFTNGDTAVVGVATTWSTMLKAGDKIKASSHTDAMYTEIASVTDDTNLVLVAGGYLGATVTTTYIARIVLHKDFIPTALAFNNNLVISNGSEKMMSYNNTTLDILTDADIPRVSFLESHKSRVFGAKTSGAPSSIFWSNVNNEASWDAASLEPIFPQDNGNICAIKSFADSLIVLKDNGGVYQVIGDFDQDVAGSPTFIRKVDFPNSIGAILGYTAAVNTDGKLYFLAETGFYALAANMSISMVSWDIKSTVNSLALKSTAISAKSYPYASKAQADAGAHNGTYSPSTGGVKAIVDLLTITDASKTLGFSAVCIDSSNNVHVAYRLGSDTNRIRYKKWLALDQTVSIDETFAAIVTGGVLLAGSISLDVSANDKVGIAARVSIDGLLYGYFYERTNSTTSGTWAAGDNIYFSSTYFTGIAWGISLRYDSNNSPGIAWAQGNSPGANPGLSFLTKQSGSWVYLEIDNGDSYYACSLEYVVANPRISAMRFDKLIRLYSSVNAGVSFSLTEALAMTSTTTWRTDGLQLSHNNANNSITGYFDDGKLKKRNHTTTTTSTLVDDSTAIFKGYRSRYDTPTTTDMDNLYYSRVSTTRKETVLYETSLSVTNSTGGITSNVFCGDRSMHNNGRTFVTISYGANANEILVRRIAYQSQWISPETSDSTLTAWGTYDISNLVQNSATTLFEVALNTVSPATTYATIANGALISTDATKIFFRTRVTYSLGDFTAPSVDSIIANFTGAGIDAKLPWGYVFDNEYYTSVANAGSTGNDLLILYDRDNAFTTMTPAVIVMTRYKNKLYAGDAVSGDVFILNQAYRYESSAYSLTATTKEDLMGSLELEKDIYKVYVIYEIQTAGTFSFDYRLDNFKTSGGATWKTNTVDQTTSGIAEVLVGNKARSIQFRVTQTALDGRLGIIGFVVMYHYLNVR